MAAPLSVALRALIGFILLVFRWVLPASARKIKFKGMEEREGGDGRDSTLKNICELMPALKSLFWRQKLKVVA
jgi:hypothetical protein